MDPECLYTTASIQVLEGLEAVRKRPGMYIGDLRDGAGLHHLLWELVANALDEHLAGRASKIRVSVEADLAEVEDDGRGIPLELDAERDWSRLELVLTRLHGGATFDGHLPHVHVSSLRGCGLAVVNALSAELEVEVWQQGYSWRQRYARGRRLCSLERGQRAARTGTRIRFRPDPLIFDRTLFDRSLIRDRLEELAIWNPQLTWEWMSTSIREPEGVLRWLDRLATERGVERSSQALVVSALEASVLVEVAASWSAHHFSDLRSFVGQTQTPDGGSHEAGFWQGMVDALALRNEHAFRKPPRGTLWRRVLAPGLLGVVHVSLPDAEFAGPTRSRLSSAQAFAAVRAVVARAFAAELEREPELEALFLRRIAAFRATSISQ